jgi:hypothetical protein
MARGPTAREAKLQPWIDARRRHRLSHAHIQMARELGINPKEFGGLDNHRQEPRKAPLPIFIESLYFKRFGKERPDIVRTIEETLMAQLAKKQARREASRRELRARAGWTSRASFRLLEGVDANSKRDAISQTTRVVHRQPDQIGPVRKERR